MSDTLPLRALEAALRAEAFAYQGKIRAAEDGMEKLVLAAEMGALAGVSRAVSKAASALEDRGSQ